MRPRVLFGVLAPVLLVSTAAAAGGYEPRRDLTDAERLEYSVAESELVGMGNILGVVDALAAAPGSPHLSPYRYVLLQPEKWLKGDLPLRPLPVGFGDPASPVFERLRERAKADSGHVLIFLRRRPGLPGAPEEPPKASGKGAPKEAASDPTRLPRYEYLVDESPYLYGGGVAGLQPGDEEVVLRTLDEATRSRSMESLVVNSSLAVLGTALGEAPCRVAGRDGECTRVRIDQMLAGSTLDAEISVYSLLPEGVPQGQSLYFLRATADGPYEILSFSAGVMPVVNGRVQPLGKRLEEVQAGILAVVRAKRGPGD
jgi:hypothetical protein